MADFRTKHDPELNRMRDTYGETAEVPRTPFGATAGMLKGQQPLAARIADLAKQVSEAAFLLGEARERHHEANARRSQCEAEFANAAAGLIQALNEHREGTPENVPYQP